MIIFPALSIVRVKWFRMIFYKTIFITTSRLDDDIHDELLGLSLIHHLYGSDDLENVDTDLEVDGNDLEDRNENDLERPSIPRLAN